MIRVTAQPDRAPEGFHTPGMGILVDVRTLVFRVWVPAS
jgi:hypothetical protein